LLEELEGGLVVAFSGVHLAQRKTRRRKIRLVIGQAGKDFARRIQLPLFQERHAFLKILLGAQLRLVRLSFSLRHGLALCSFARQLNGGTNRGRIRSWLPAGARSGTAIRRVASQVEFQAV
jgi:hypothetical protein